VVPRVRRQNEIIMGNEEIGLDGPMMNATFQESMIGRPKLTLGEEKVQRDMYRFVAP
jgi:hypothetical protein